jgi:mxaJ protein
MSWPGAVLAALALLAPSLTTFAQAEPVERKALRVCQDPNNLPFSNTAGTGIENRIADIFGKELGLPVIYYSFPQRMAFIRNTLRFKLPGQDYPCDIVMGVPVGFDQVSVTQPYYKSSYAIVFPTGKGMDHVTSSDEFLRLDKAKLDTLRIGVYDRSPASAWLNKHGLVERGVPYQILNADPTQYPGEIIERDLTGGKIDVAIVWGPIAGYFAKRSKSTPMKVVLLKSEPGVQSDYQMAMGVRYGEPEWKKQVESLLKSKQGEIRAVLDEYGVPLVDDAGAPAKPKQ